MEPRERTDLLKHDTVLLHRISQINTDRVFNDALEALKSHEKLVRLQITCQNGLGNLELSEARLRRLAEVLRSPHVSAKLKELNIGGACIDPNGMATLAGALKGCASLTEIVLDDAKTIGEEGAKELLKHLSQAGCKCKLEKLEFGRDKVAKALHEKFKPLLVQNKQQKV